MRSLSRSMGVVAWLLLICAGATLSRAQNQTCTPVTVKSGDTLSAIATTAGFTTEAVLAANPDIKNASLIEVGEVIKLPCTLSNNTGSSTPAGVNEGCAPVTVKLGDTITKIASAAGYTAGAVLAANPNITDANQIQVGQAIQLPCSLPNITVSLTPAEFNKTLTANNYTGQNDTVLTQMLATISKLGNQSVISSRTELAMFLAQAYFESGGLAILREVNGSNASYAPYYGRGYLQLTGRANYIAAGQALYNNATLLVNDPDLIIRNMSVDWDVSVWYWKVNVHSRPGISNGTFGASTRAINSVECQSPNVVTAQNRCKIYTNVLPILVNGTTANCSGCATS